MKRMTLGVSVALVIAVTAGFAQAQGFSAGVRLWNANWAITHEDGGENDVGTEPYLLGYLGYHDAGYSVIGQLGAGSWDDDGVGLDRMDISLAVTTVNGQLSYGAGGRALLYETDLGEEKSYLGPELLLGGAFPLDAEKKLSAMLSGSLGIYFWDYESARGYQDDGTVLGFSLDGGLGYVVDTVNVRGGYRYQRMDEDGKFYGDEFAGPYIELGLIW